MRSVLSWDTQKLHKTADNARAAREVAAEIDLPAREEHERVCEHPNSPRCLKSPPRSRICATKGGAALASWELFCRERGEDRLLPPREPASAATQPTTTPTHSANGMQMESALVRSDPYGP